MRGVSPCGGSSTQSSVKSARTASASPLSQASSYLLCTRFIFARSSADRVPADKITVQTNDSETPSNTLRIGMAPPGRYLRLDARNESTSPPGSFVRAREKRIVRKREGARWRRRRRVRGRCRRGRGCLLQRDGRSG